MNIVDIFFILLYFILVLYIGYWVYKKQKDKEKSEEYFLSGRDVGWLAIGASLFASNIGSEHLVGLAGSGAAGGLAVGHFEWLACFILILLGYLFVPFYLKSGVYTMPEFLELRYGKAHRFFLSTVSILGYVLTKISVTLYAGAVVIKALTGLDIFIGAIILILITGIYTVLGGLRAVIYTEILQTFVLILGSVILTVIGLIKVGGWSGLVSKVPADYFSIWKGINHPEFPWTGILLGAPILGIWYWCADQHIVQRVLAAKNIQEARYGTIFAAFLKILPVFIFVLPGVIAFALFPQVAANPDIAYPMLVKEILPMGLKGIIIASMLAALMSSLSSAFNACSTLITWDFYKKLKPNAEEKELVYFGRIATSMLVIISLLWVPFIKYISPKLYIYLQSVQAYIAPPIAACFLIGILSSRANSIGALLALYSGFIIGSSRLVLEILYNINNGWVPSFLHWFVKINFLHFAFIMFIIAVFFLFIGQFIKKETLDEVKSNLVVNKEFFANYKMDRLGFILSLIVCFIILVLWFVFR